MTVADTKTELPELVVGSAFTLGTLSEGQVMCLASASPDGSDDPVDRATAEAMRAEYPQLPVINVAGDEVDPATLERRYSVTRVREFPIADGETADLIVLRGDLDSVITKSRTTREERSVIKRNGDVVSRRGWRPLAVATAPYDQTGDDNQFKLQGFVAVSPRSVHAALDDVTSGPSNWTRVNVWSVTLRIQHWSNVILILVMSATGFLIMDPSLVPPSVAQTGFLMGWIRFLHFLAAFLWLILGVTRAWAAFTSKDRFVRWPTLWPIKSKEDVRNFLKVVQHYTFIKEHAPLYLAHNPLQQLTYTGVYLLCALQLIAGFALFGLYNQANAIWALVATPVHWFGIANVRSFHTGVMFAIWVFVVIHIYLAFRADSLERHGGVSAMINGAVWMQRGSKPVDGQRID